MTWDWIMAGIVAYFVVGVVLLVWLSSRDRSLSPYPDWSGVLMVIGWPLLVLTWAIFRLPEPRAGAALVRNQPVGLPPAGIAISELCPFGTVEVAGRRYAATAEGRSVKAGEPVEIIGRAGRTLRVRGCAVESDPTTGPVGN